MRGRRRLGARPPARRQASTAPAATPRKPSRALDRRAEPRRSAGAATQARRPPSPKASTACACARGFCRPMTAPFGLFRATALSPMTPAQRALPMKAEAARQDARLQYLPFRAQIRPCCREGRGLRRLPRRRAHQGLFRLAALRPAQAGAAGELPRRQRRVLRDLPHAGVETARRRRREGDLRHPQSERQSAPEREDGAQRSAANCHGLQFTLDALADPALVGEQFQRRPAVHIESIEWAERRAKRARPRRAQVRRLITDIGKEIEMPYQLRRLGAVAVLAAVRAAAATAASRAMVRHGETEGIPLQQVADMLHAVMAADRTVYTTRVVNRLQNEDKVIKASEHSSTRRRCRCRRRCSASAPRGGGEDARLLLLAAVAVADQQAERRRTAAEKEGLKFVADNKGKNFTPKRPWAARNISPPSTPTPRSRRPASCITPRRSPRRISSSAT